MTYYIESTDTQSILQMNSDDRVVFTGENHLRESHEFLVYVMIKTGRLGF